MERGRTDGLQLTVPARPQSSSPLYIRLAERIAAEIACGGLADGEALPAERILSDQLSVSRTTVRKALDELTAKGLIVSRRGSGNFVAARLQQPLARLSSFTEDRPRPDGVGKGGAAGARPVGRRRTDGA